MEGLESLSLEYLPLRGRDCQAWFACQDRFRLSISIHIQNSQPRTNISASIETKRYYPEQIFTLSRLSRYVASDDPKLIVGIDMSQITPNGAIQVKSYV